MALKNLGFFQPWVTVIELANLSLWSCRNARCFGNSWAPLSLSYYVSCVGFCRANWRLFSVKTVTCCALSQNDTFKFSCYPATAPAAVCSSRGRGAGL